MKNFLRIFSLVFLLQSCESIKSYKKQNQIVELKNDNKFMSLKAPKGYCFYDKNDAVEKDVINIVSAINKSEGARLELLLQDCEEKKNFLISTNPTFRNTLMIFSFSPENLKIIKKYRLDRDRKTFVEFHHKSGEKETVASINKLVNKTIIPYIKKHNDLTLIDKSTALNLSQKEELKLAHGEIFKKKKHIALTLDKKFAPEIADYEASSYQIGKITYYCSNATSLINYIPLNFFLCEEIITDKTKSIDERLLEYVKETIKLNKD
ncbi:MAG: hypothetical protein V4694_05330 [Pseudomonadota bacterium]